MIPSRMIASPLAWALLAGAACLLVAALGGPPDTFWTVDDAGKDLVLRNLLRHPVRATLDYPGRALDPELALFPMPLGGSEPYAARHGDAIVSQYAAPFVWLTLPLAAAWPAGARALLPAFGAALAVFVTFRLGARLGGGAGSGARAAALALAATPLLFYGALFWEHTLTIALAGAAFLALTDARGPRALAAGLLLGGAILLREELVLLAAAVVVAAAGEGPPFRVARGVALGAAAGLAARLAFHFVTSGAWLGVHAALNRPDPFVHAARAVEGLLLGSGASGAPPWAAAAALAALALGARGGTAGRALGAAGAAALAALAVLAWWRFPGGEDAALALRHSNSALVALPWALAAPFLPAPPRDAAAADAERLLGRAALVFLVLFVTLVPSRSITGVHPGPRMLLPLLPLAAAVAAARLGGSRFGVAALAPLLAVGAAWAGTSLALLHAKRTLSGDLAAALRARPETVVCTDLFWIPTDMSALWDGKRFFLLRDDRDLARLTDAARAAGETGILAVMAPGRLEADPVAQVRDPALPAFSADVHVLRLVRP